jgi:hypothetical protein
VCSAIPAPLSSWLATRCLGLVPISCASAVTTGGRSVSGLPTVMTKCTSISCAWWSTLCRPQSLVLVTFNAHQVLLVPLPMQSQVLCISHVHLLLVNTGTPLGTGSLIPLALPTICLWAGLATLQGSISHALPCSCIASLRTPRPSSMWLIAAATSIVRC